MKESTQQHGSQFEWTVIGAGPAGMAAVGRLIDAGVNSKRIAWIDPHFTVGDFGTKWRGVSSNTRAGLFVKFLHECKAFRYVQCREMFRCMNWIRSKPVIWNSWQSRCNG